MCNCGGCQNCLTEQQAVLYVDCPRCGVEVKAIINGNYADGTCPACKHEFEISLQES